MVVAVAISSLDGSTINNNVNGMHYHHRQLRPLSPLVRRLKILSWLGGFPLSICTADTEPATSTSMAKLEDGAMMCNRNQFGKIKHNIFSQLLAMVVLLTPAFPIMYVFVRCSLNWSDVYYVFKENGFTFWDTFGIVISHLLAMLVQWPEIMYLARMGDDLNKLSNKMAGLCASFGRNCKHS